MIGNFYSSGAKNVKALAMYSGSYEKHDIDNSMDYDEFKLFGVFLHFPSNQTIAIQTIR